MGFIRRSKQTKKWIFHLTGLIWRPSIKSSAALFCDADGVLWADRGPGSIKFREGFEERSKRISEIARHLGLHRLIIVTNQTAVSRGTIAKSEMIKELSNVADSLISLFQSVLICYCFHHPRANLMKYRINCKCRKPKNKLFKLAIRKNNINLSKSIMIGDRITDIEASFNSNVPNNYLVLNERAFELNEISSFNKQSLISITKFIKLDQNNSFLPSIRDYDDNYDVLILTAGNGQRLKPLTDSWPKSLLQIGDETILSRLIKTLIEFNPNVNIYINGNKFSYILAKYLQDNFYQHDINFIWERSLLGPALTVSEFSKITKRNLLVIHGDLVYEKSDLLGIFNELVNSNISKVVCHSRDFKGSRNDLVLGSKFVLDLQFFNGSNEFFSESRKVHSDSGIYWLVKSDLRKLSTPSIGTGISRSFLPYLISNKSLGYVLHHGTRYAVDSILTYNQVKRLAWK